MFAGRVPPTDKNVQYDLAVSILRAGGRSLINVPDCRGELPLHVAVSYGDIGATRAFIEFGADVNNEASLQKPSPLYFALQKYSQNYSVLLELLETNFAFGKGSLHMLISGLTTVPGRIISQLNQRVEEHDESQYSNFATTTVKLALRLLDSGGDVNQLDEKGDTPLSLLLDSLFHGEVHTYDPNLAIRLNSHDIPCCGFNGAHAHVGSNVIASSDNSDNSSTLPARHTFGHLLEPWAEAFVHTFMMLLAQGAGLGIRNNTGDTPMEQLRRLMDYRVAHEFDVVLATLKTFIRLPPFSADMITASTNSGDQSRGPPRLFVHQEMCIDPQDVSVSRLQDPEAWEPFW